MEREPSRWSFIAAADAAAAATVLAKATAAANQAGRVYQTSGELVQELASVPNQKLV